MLLKSIVSGMRFGRLSIGSVKSTWRRSGETGSSTPASAPAWRDQAPAAQITVSVRTVLPLALTALILPSRCSIVSTSWPVSSCAPNWRAA